ncbi:MAG: hypothetical protein NUW01_18470 [Gemmatimonadaceae bacterium]|nr:hypothetical protein [Gemmatimonadaceae bacterium]
MIDISLVLSLTLLEAVLGAMAVRWRGSGDSHRWLKLPVMALLAWPLFLVMPWHWALAGAGLCVLFFVKGHKARTWTVWLRYGPFAFGYVLAKRYLPEPWRLNDYIDGWMAVGELTLGGSFWGSLTLVCLAFAVWS